MPKNYHTKILLDSGDPEQTDQILGRNLTLAGQTTNPTLVAKSPMGQSCLSHDGKCSRTKLMRIYQQIITEISSKIPQGAISAEVYADERTSAPEMIRQGQMMSNWIEHVYVKLPITMAGLAAAEELVAQGINVNMTLCFSLDQAAAVYAATARARKGQVFISPFVGRLDDTGVNGMSLLKNIIELYKKGDGHVQVLAASIRSLDHVRGVLDLGTDMFTAPVDILNQFADTGFVLPDDFSYDAHGLTDISFNALDLHQSYQSYNIAHPLTSAGLQKFAADWNALITEDTKKPASKNDLGGFGGNMGSGNMGIGGILGLGMIDSK